MACEGYSLVPSCVLPPVHTSAAENSTMLSLIQWTETVTPNESCPLQVISVKCSALLTQEIHTTSRFDLDI